MQAVLRTSIFAIFICYCSLTQASEDYGFLDGADAKLQEASSYSELTTYFQKVHEQLEQDTVNAPEAEFSQQLPLEKYHLSYQDFLGKLEELKLLALAEKDPRYLSLVLTELVYRGRKDSEAYFQRALTYIQVKQYTQATNLLNTAVYIYLHEKKKNRFLLAKIAAYFFFIGEQKRAYETIEVMHKLFPRTTDEIHHIARMQYGLMTGLLQEKSLSSLAFEVIKNIQDEKVRKSVLTHFARRDEQADFYDAAMQELNNFSTQINISDVREDILEKYAESGHSTAIAQLEQLRDKQEEAFKFIPCTIADKELLHHAIRFYLYAENDSFPKLVNLANHMAEPLDSWTLETIVRKDEQGEWSDFLKQQVMKYPQEDRSSISLELASTYIYKQLYELSNEFLYLAQIYLEDYPHKHKTVDLQSIINSYRIENLIQLGSLKEAEILLREKVSDEVRTRSRFSDEMRFSSGVYDLTLLFAKKQLAQHTLKEVLAMFKWSNLWLEVELNLFLCERSLINKDEKLARHHLGEVIKAFPNFSYHDNVRRTILKFAELFMQHNTLPAELIASAKAYDAKHPNKVSHSLIYDIAWKAIEHGSVTHANEILLASTSLEQQQAILSKIIAYYEEENEAYPETPLFDYKQVLHKYLPVESFWSAEPLLVR